MRVLLKLGIVALLAAAGCESGTVCSAVGCFDAIGVTLEPEVASTYDVDFVLDGTAGAFTCSSSNGGWQVTSPTGSVPVERCASDSFFIRATPASVEITIAAQDGSWTGSVNTSPSYETVQPNGPDCPPACEVASLTVLQQSICGSERPCIPEETWVVTYDTGFSNLVAGPNTIRIDANGAEVIGEQVPYNNCTPQDPTPGNLMTSAELSSDGCTLTAEISKSYCESGEDQCEERSITVDFCNGGSSIVAVGSLRICVCWVTGAPFCVDDTDYETLPAAATRMTQ